ncbi:archaeal ATPase [Beggiatoa sp. PS]|nr:archaeal ATPase [Beggiatoa sp. PS]
MLDVMKLLEYFINDFFLPFLAFITALFIFAAIYGYREEAKKRRTPSQTQKLGYSPFFYGSPVSPNQFIGRQKEVRRLAGRIVTGQSSAITGTFRSGKTSILKYLMAPETQIELYGDRADSLIFSNLDANTLKTECDQTEFWERILEPLQQRIHTKAANSSLAQAHQLCQKNAFENRDLEKLIAQIKQFNWQLVLMIDEFEVLLDRPSLNNTEFFGGLRGLVSQSDGALILVMTINISLTELHRKAKPFTSGSPYFNFLDEIVLGPLSNEEVEKLLRSENIYFTDEDRDFITNLAGKRPFLLQVVASVLWESYKTEQEKDIFKRQNEVKQEVYDRTKETLNDTWQSWTLTTRKAFTAVALASLESLQKVLKIEPVDIKERIDNEMGFKSALYELEKQGFVKQEDEHVEHHWQIYPTIWLTFLADQPKQTLRELFLK